MTEVRALLAALTFSLFSAACVSVGPPGNIVTRTDSAGVTIVHNSGPAPTDGGGWSIGTEATFSIGALEGEAPYQFFQVSGTHRFADGRIGVVNAGTREVRIYSEDGTHLRTYGRQGEGPEEFQIPILAGAISDTLIVLGRSLHRLSYVHPDIGFVRVFRVSDDVGGYLNPVGAFGNGDVVFGGAFDMTRTGELHTGMNRAPTYYRSSGPNGYQAADFGYQQGAEFYIKNLAGDGNDARPALYPFAKVPVAATSPDYLFFSDQDAYEIKAYNPDGSLEFLVRLAWEPIPVSAADGAKHVDDVVAQVGDPSQEPEIRQRFAGLPLPDVFPPHGGLMADNLGYLWVEEFQRPGFENRAWTIFDPRGELTGRVSLPENFNPMEIGADYILGVGWDEMNVEHVRMYSVVRPR